MAAAKTCSSLMDTSRILPSFFFPSLCVRCPFVFSSKLPPRACSCCCLISFPINKRRSLDRRTLCVSHLKIWGKKSQQLIDREDPGGQNNKRPERGRTDGPRRDMNNTVHKVSLYVPFFCLSLSLTCTLASAAYRDRYATD